MKNSEVIDEIRHLIGQGSIEEAFGEGYILGKATRQWRQMRTMALD